MNVVEEYENPFDAISYLLKNLPEYEVHIVHSRKSANIVCCGENLKELRGYVSNVSSLKQWWDMTEAILESYSSGLTEVSEDGY